jgi:high affinity sulfate transporter 1
VSSNSRLSHYLPILSWLPSYRREWLRPDFIAGLVVLTLLVPEGMAYAQMAGLPPETAFYTAPAAMIGYAIFSTSRQVITTTTSTIAVMIASVLTAIAVPGTDEYIALASSLAVMVGIIFLVARFLRLGFMSEFFSKPVITGFIFGLAMMIAIRQVPKLFGVESGGEDFFERVLEIIRHLPETNPATLFVGVTSLALMFGLERFFHRMPAALLTLVYGIAISTIFGLAGQGVHVVGDVPAGIAPPQLPTAIFDNFIPLFTGAMAIVLLGYAETVGAARKFASKHRYDLDSNQELAALGVANIGAGLFQGFAVDASLSKSAANDNNGAKTEMSAIIAAGLTIITALFLTPLFRNLPEATLAAIVIVAVWGLFDVAELRRYRRLDRPDFWLAVVALFGVLVLGVIPGLIIAVVLSILLIVSRASQPHFSILGKFPGEQTYGDIERHPENQQVSGLLIVRPDAFLFYANATPLHEELRKLSREIDPPSKVILLDLEASKDLDVTSLDMLAEAQSEIADRGAELWVARIHHTAMDRFRASGLADLIGEDHLYPSVHQAVSAYLEAYPDIKLGN